MTHFIRNGNYFDVADDQALDIHDTLPVGTYTVKYDEAHDRFFYEQVENFEIRGKVYGDTQAMSDRILNTFKDRPNSTGVLLTGEKGSGKTLLAKMLSLDAQIENIPTIVINNPWCGDSFNKFMQMLEQPSVVIFDEFEKVYDRDQQAKMLTLLDGVYASKKLYVITSNDKWRIDANMRNRPGRLYYRLEYKGLDDAFIREYCEDTLKDKSHIDSICKMAILFGEFNFDLLKAMVEEMNRYGESARDAMRVLNAKPEQSEEAVHTLTLTIRGRLIPQTDVPSVWGGNPMAREIVINYETHDEATRDDDGDTGFADAHFTPADLKTVDPATGTFYFENALGEALTLTKKRVVEYDYHVF